MEQVTPENTGTAGRTQPSFWETATCKNRVLLQGILRTQSTGGEGQVAQVLWLRIQILWIWHGSYVFWLQGVLRTVSEDDGLQGHGGIVRRREDRLNKLCHKCSELWSQVAVSLGGGASTLTHPSSSLIKALPSLILYQQIETVDDTCAT